MSTEYTAYCSFHQVDGPDLRRSAGACGLIDPDAWAVFLIEHQRCHLHLIHEGDQFRPEWIEHTEPAPSG